MATREELQNNLSNNYKWSFNPMFSRTNSQPLDTTSIVFEKSELTAYAQSNETAAYPGQLVSVVGESYVHPYYIDNDGSVKEIGSNLEGGLKVAGKIYGFADAEITGSIKTTSIILSTNSKTYTITNETIDNLNTRIDNLTNETNTGINGLNTRVDNLAGEVNGLKTADLKSIIQEAIDKGDIDLNVEAQVQADWNQTNTSSKAYIKNKPDITKTPQGIIKILEKLNISISESGDNVEISFF